MAGQALAPGSYYEFTRKGQVYCAYATVTTPAIWSSATGTGGPLIWNGTGPVSGTKGLRGVEVVLLAIGLGLTTAAGAAGAIGITGGPSTAPTTTTAIDGIANLNIGGPLNTANAYRIGTPSAAGTFFFPTHNLTTATLASGEPAMMEWVDLHGLFVANPGNFLSVAASAALTSAVVDIGLIYAEIPL
jgi:hypothetical protein